MYIMIKLYPFIHFNKAAMFLFAVGHFEKSYFNIELFSVSDMYLIGVFKLLVV